MLLENFSNYIVALPLNMFIFIASIVVAIYIKHEIGPCEDPFNFNVLWILPFFALYLFNLKENSLLHASYFVLSTTYFLGEGIFLKGKSVLFKYKGGITCTYFFYSIILIAFTTNYFQTVNVISTVLMQSALGLIASVLALVCGYLSTKSRLLSYLTVVSYLSLLIVVIFYK